MYSQVIDIARRAGSAIMEVYQGQDFDVTRKGDDSPLTAADLAAHRVIVDQLAQLTPERPVLSEESADIPWSERQRWTSYWLVDPLDGTKEFIKRNDEFTVNIALVENGEPVWGVVYAPALDILYQGGVAAQGAWKFEPVASDRASAESRPTGLQSAENRIQVARPESGGPIRIVGSRSHGSPEFEAFVAQYDNPVIKSMGSSLKICLVAEGAADVYPRLGPTSEWDTAAAHAVLLGAGGRLVEAGSRTPLRYNQKESVLNPHFMAWGA